MRRFLAAAATIALATTIAHADPGGGKGGGKGGDHGAPAKVQNNGGGKADHGAAMKQDRGPVMKQDRGPQRTAERGPSKHENRGSDHASRPAKADRAERRKDRRVERQVDRGDERIDRRGNRGMRDRDDGVIVDRVRDDRRVRRVAHFDFDENRGLIDGCPPGLAKKTNGCMPPGLLRNRDRDRDLRFTDAFYRPNWWGYDRLGAQRVYYDDGYLYRLGDNNSILGYIPLLGGALSVGNVWPSMYQPVPVPDYYVDYYNLGPQGSYRYADNVLYRVDPESAAITSIAALLTGDNFTVGQPMPLGYDVYNVPYAYRDQYYDRPDALYRYSDGYVYQVDPETRLIAAAIELLI